MSVANIIKKEFVIPRLNKWKLNYSQYFILGGFDGILHTPAQTLSFYVLVTMQRQIDETVDDIKNVLREILQK